MPSIVISEEELHEAVRDFIEKKGLTRLIGSRPYGTQFMLRPKSSEELASKPGTSPNTFEVRVSPVLKGEG